MTDLRLTFDLETMLGLTSLQFNQLTQTGTTITEFAPAKNYHIQDNWSKLFLTFNNSLGSYYFEFEPQKDIDMFLTNSHLTYFFPKTGEIKLINGFEKSLRDILLERRDDVSNISMMDKLSFKESQDIFSDPFVDTSLGELLKSGNFKGQISCCECGIAGCSSEYLWAEENFGLASFHILAAGLNKIQLYPFKLC